MVHIDAIKSDLKHRLRRDYTAIVLKYASYVRCIKMSLIAKKVPVRDLYSFLLGLPFEYDQQTATELENAKTIDDIFIALQKYFSFWDHEVFQCLIKEYNLDHENKEKLLYIKHFESYVQKHKVSHFVKINPLLNKHAKRANGSKKLTLKFDVDTINCSLAKVNELKEVVANSLNVNPSSLRLLSINEGCMELTFLIPAPKADAVFTEDWKQVSERSDDLQAAAVVSVTCNDNTFNIKERKLTRSKDQKINTLSGKYLVIML